MKQETEIHQVREELKKLSASYLSTPAEGAEIFMKKYQALVFRLFKAEHPEL